VQISVRVQPGARKAAVEGVVHDATGAPAIKVRVPEPPHDGKANAAVVRLLARAWGVPKSRLHLVAGARNRTKTLFLDGPPATTLTRLNAWLADLDAAGKSPRKRKGEPS